MADTGKNIGGIVSGIASALFHVVEAGRSCLKKALTDLMPMHNIYILFSNAF
jgi:hypothetical protein